MGSSRGIQRLGRDGFLFTVPHRFSLVQRLVLKKKKDQEITGEEQ
jgi:hypothetical protein